jgi:hypothetical protein
MTLRVPMIPLAPGLGSIITGWPMELLIFCATTRANRSADPPAGNGATISMRRDGNSWAFARRKSGSPVMRWIRQRG